MALKKKKVSKKKETKKKPSVKDEPKKTAIGLHNVLPYLVAEMSAQSRAIEDLHRKIDNLHKTVDAVGIAVVENK